MQQDIERIAQEAGAEAVAVACHDYETDTTFSFQGDRWFHAASTIKVLVLLSLFDAIEEGRFTLTDRLHVRNRFLSAAQGEPYRVSAGRDANSDVYKRLGLTMRLGELAHHMIVTSSNLATNLLVDLLGAEAVQQRLKARGLSGIDFQRGVEDEAAFEARINNRVTAHGLVRFYRILYEQQNLSEDAAQQMLDILFAQQFKSGIPAGLPDDARVAHKTGDISTVTHDAGLVYLPDRKPYAVAILTQWKPEASDRRETVATLSKTVYSYLMQADADA